MEKQLHEPFHRLQMNLDMLSHERPLRTILVASAAPGEGKSIVTRNLALAYREAGRNVAVLDADFRKATLGGLLNAQEGPGLTDILAGRATFGQAVQEVTVPRGENGNGAGGAHIAIRWWRCPGAARVMAISRWCRPVPHHGNLAATLASGGMRQTLNSATDIYDRVSDRLLALPGCGRCPAAALRGRRRAPGDPSRREHAGFGEAAAERAQARLRTFNVLGVVVNGIPPRTYRTRAYGYYYG